VSNNVLSSKSVHQLGGLPIDKSAHQSVEVSSGKPVGESVVQPVDESRVSM